MITPHLTSGGRVRLHLLPSFPAGIRESAFLSGSNSAPIDFLERTSTTAAHVLYKRFWAVVFGGHIFYARSRAGPRYLPKVQGHNEGSHACRCVNSSDTKKQSVSNWQHSERFNQSSIRKITKSTPVGWDSIRKKLSQNAQQRRKVQNERLHTKHFVKDD